MLVAGAAVVALPTPRWLEKVVQETPATRVVATAKITCVDGTVYYAPVVEHVVTRESEQRRFELISTRDGIQPQMVEFDYPGAHVHHLDPLTLNNGDSLSLAWTITLD